MTSILSNLEQVTWNTGKYAVSRYGLTIFYELGFEHNEAAMIEVFRTKNYNELVDYLFSIGEEWRLER